jgi:glycosyltransferase involved in cell wall biosynthesis
VACVSAATRDELLKYGLVEPERAVVVPNGVHPSCSPEPDQLADREAARFLGEPANDALEILHVGSTIPRKRIDVLLETFAAVRAQFPAARLIRAGGEFTEKQVQLIGELELDRSVVVLPELERNVLAAVYRRATVLLQPSEREGFGLPIVEALACGTPVVASDLPALREVGGEAVAYCPVGDLSSWQQTVTQLLNERTLDPQLWDKRRFAGISQAAKFSWTRSTERMVELYLSVQAEPRPSGRA